MWLDIATRCTEKKGSVLRGVSNGGSGRGHLSPIIHRLNLKDTQAGRILQTKGVACAKLCGGRWEAGPCMRIWEMARVPEVEKARGFSHSTCPASTNHQQTTPPPASPGLFHGGFKKATSLKKHGWLFPYNYSIPQETKAHTFQGSGNSSGTRLLTRLVNLGEVAEWSMDVGAQNTHYAQTLPPESSLDHSLLKEKGCIFWLMISWCLLLGK